MGQASAARELVQSAAMMRERGRCGNLLRGESKSGMMDLSHRFAFDEPDKTQSEPITQYSTSNFLQQLTFPQVAILAYLSSKH